jgi:soluble lytic murein transglycosylase-like protein
MPYVRARSPYSAPRLQGGARRRLPRGLGQASLTPTQQQIVSAANNAGVDPALALAVAQQESGFNPNAISSAGATGLFQLMPATAASLGVNPSDPTQNIQGGISYLAQLLEQYGGDVSNALWAYNAGPGNQAAGVLPAQTAAYIPSVLSLQDNWAQLLGTSTASSSSTSTAGDSSSSDESGDDDTLLYVGLGLAASALALFALA